MKQMKLAALALACVFALAGCGKGKDSASDQTSAIKSSNFGDEVVVTVGDREVTKSEYNYYLTNYRNTFAMDESKRLALDYCENHNLLIALGKAMGIEFDSEKQDEIKDTKNKVMASYEQNGGYKNFLKENDVTDEFIDDLVAVGYYSEALKEKMEKKEYTDEEKKDFFNKNYRRAKHILISTKDAETNEDLPEDKIQEAEKKAQELLERAKSGEDFDALVSEFSEDPGSASNPKGYVFTDDEMVKEFQDGVDAINPGEFTLVKTSYGYHVIQRLALDGDAEYYEQQYASVADNLPDIMDSKRFEEQVHTWADEYGIKTTVNQEIIDAME